MDIAVSNSHPTAGQFRAARAYLGWTLIQAAHNAAVSPISIVQVEKERGIGTESARKALLKAYADVGVIFHGSATEGLGLTIKASANCP